MTPAEPIHGIRMSAGPLSDEEILRRVRETVEGRQRINDLFPIQMRPSRGYISLVSCVLLRPPRPSCLLRLQSVSLLRLSFLQGMRDVRASPPPVPEDAERRAENRALAEAHKERKDADEARRKRKSLERDELEKRRRRQRLEGLPEEPSPSSSSMEFSSDDDESEVGRGPLDHLPDVRETVPGASASGPAAPGEGSRFPRPRPLPPVSVAAAVAACSRAGLSVRTSLPRGSKANRRFELRARSWRPWRRSR
jgi:hypothetical protein